MIGKAGELRHLVTEAKLDVLAVIATNVDRHIESYRLPYWRKKASNVRRCTVGSVEECFPKSDQC